MEARSKIIAVLPKLNFLFLSSREELLRALSRQRSEVWCLSLEISETVIDCYAADLPEREIIEVRLRKRNQEEEAGTETESARGVLIMKKEGDLLIYHWQNRTWEKIRER